MSASTVKVNRQSAVSKMGMYVGVFVGGTVGGSVGEIVGRGVGEETVVSVADTVEIGSGVACDLQPVSHRPVNKITHTP